MMTRREFGVVIFAIGVQARKTAGATSLDDVLRLGVQRRRIPAAAAMVATAERITYQGAFGKRDVTSGSGMTLDSIFAIASMTKAITSAAALQLVEQKKVTLDEPVAKHIPEFAKLQVLDGYNNGAPNLRPVRKPVTLRHLLTHTSGFCYDTWSGEMVEYEKHGGATPNGVAPFVPLMFEPGSRWHYGYSTDWTGRLVETVSGLTLEEYFQRNILKPLGMKDTSFILPGEKFDRLVSRHQRQIDGSLQQDPRVQPAPPVAFNGGGGLYSTAGDYVRFMQMILRRGRGGDNNQQILRPDTVAAMSLNQIGELTAGRLKSFQPARSSDVDMHPGAADRWGLGFLINTTPYPGGRSAGSLAWAGINNTFYWIDPKRGICATVMMQFLPFVDKEAVGLLGDFERTVYAS
jgi:CubicO group peptidase (beta-lactamase class C family)